MVEQQTEQQMSSNVFRLPEWLVTKLRKLAEDQGIPVTDYIRLQLMKHVEQSETHNLPEKDG